MLNSVKKLQIFYAKSPEISLATSPAEQAVHGVLFTFNLRTFGYRLLLIFTEYLSYKRMNLNDRSKLELILKSAILERKNCVLLCYCAAL